MKELFYSILLGCLWFSSVSAEVICTSDVGYNWNRTERGKSTELKAITKHLMTKAETEELAKEYLQKKLLAAFDEALLICHKVHENMAGCIVNKNKQNAASFAMMSYAIRKNLEDAMKEDCKKMQGICKDSYNTEIACHVKPEIVVQESVEDKKKDAKNKKK